MREKEAEEETAQQGAGEQSACMGNCVFFYVGHSIWEVWTQFFFSAADKDERVGL